MALWLVFGPAALAQGLAGESGATALLGPPAPVRQVSTNVYQVGLVRLDKQARTVTFPAVVNMNDGPIEYLLVTTTGKTHESLFRTDAEPAHIQVAMLLLGAKGAPGGWFPDPPTAGPIVGGKRGVEKGGERKVPGEPVTISVRWSVGQDHKQCPVENFVRDLRLKGPMTRGPFLFNGSRVWNGVFTAQREGSIVSLITDPDALFNNPRPGHDLDDVWEIQSKDLPPLGTPVEVTIVLSRNAGRPPVDQNKRPAPGSPP